MSGTGTGTGSRSNRSRRGSSRATTALGGTLGPDSIDIIDPGKEKTVNFANCVSPPSPHNPGFMGINNEAYPCDCCQLDEAHFRRTYSQQMPCGPSGMMHFSEVGMNFLYKRLLYYGGEGLNWLFVVLIGMEGYVEKFLSNDNSSRQRLTHL